MKGTLTFTRGLNTKKESDHQSTGQGALRSHTEEGTAGMSTVLMKNHMLAILWSPMRWGVGWGEEESSISGAGKSITYTVFKWPCS